MAGKSLGEFVRSTRMRLGISLRELARRAEMSAPFLSEIERGTRSPSDDAVQKLAASLQVSSNVLYDLTPKFALEQFRQILEEDDELRATFAQMVRELSSGKLSARKVQKRLSGQS